MIRLFRRTGSARAVLVLLLSGLPLAGASPVRGAPAARQAADLLLVNGTLVTADRTFSIKQAVAIRDGKFLAVGSNDEVRALAGPATRVIDLAGRTVLPGLIDSHIHAIRAGLTWDLELHWEQVTSLAQGLRMITERAAQAPAGTWIRVVGGWHESQFAEKRAPTVAELDAAAPNHPVWMQRLYERVILNTAAQHALGITAETRDPRGGKVLKDASGKPTGVVTGAGGINAWYSRLPRPALEEEIQSTRNWFRELNRVGLTTAGDVAGGGLVWPDGYRAVNALHDRGELTVRLRWYIQPNRPGQEMDVIRRFIAAVPVGSGDDMLRPVGVGEQVQGSVHDGDAFVAVPPRFAPEALAEWGRIVKLIVESGWRFQVHATRDSSARQLLPVIEEINRRIPLGDRRVAFAHLEDVAPETIGRIKALGGGITVQDRMAYNGGDVVRNLGKAFARRAPPLKTMLRLGVPVGAGTDATRVASYNPFWSLWWLVSGKTLGGEAIRGPEENLSREEALQVYTTGSAWFSFDEGKLGSIEPGKLADLIVLSADYLTVPEDRIRDLESVLTIVGGKPVYAAAEYRALVSH